VFVFTVALKDGFNIITAQAGEVQDTMTLEKVEKEPEIYVLPEVNERAEGVANWFQTVGDMDLKAPMEFPEGRYSIKDTMEELAKKSGSNGNCFKSSKTDGKYDRITGGRHVGYDEEYVF